MKKGDILLLIKPSGFVESEVIRTHGDYVNINNEWQDKATVESNLIDVIGKVRYKYVPFMGKVKTIKYFGDS